MTPAPGAWLVHRRREQEASWRLVAIPHAGAGAGAFASWPARIGADCELYAVRLPGRESRYAEPPIASVPAAARAIAAELSTLPPLPTVVFGYSLGALVAYELARTLAASPATRPLLLAAGGHEAPHLPRRTEPIHLLPDDEFAAALRTLAGSPDALLDDPALRAIYLPILRADLRLVETYRHEGALALDTDVRIYCGRDDTALEPAGVTAWADTSARSIRHRWFAGGHFFHTVPGEPLTAALAGDVRAALLAQHGSGRLRR